MKAILQNGLIYPREALPKDWKDGTELQVEKLSNGSSENSDELDRWMEKVQSSANEVDAEDEIILERTIREVRKQARELSRREAGNP